MKSLLLLATFAFTMAAYAEDPCQYQNHRDCDRRSPQLYTPFVADAMKNINRQQANRAAAEKQRQHEIKMLRLQIELERARKVNKKSDE